MTTRQPFTPTIAPEVIAAYAAQSARFNVALAESLTRYDAELAERAAERAASGLQVGDVVRIKGGGHSDEYARITGVNRLGAWEVTLDSGMPSAYSSRGLELAAAVSA